MKILNEKEVTVLSLDSLIYNDATIRNPERRKHDNDIVILVLGLYLYFPYFRGARIESITNIFVLRKAFSENLKSSL